MSDDKYTGRYRRRNGLDMVFGVLIVFVLIVMLSPDPLSLFTIGRRANARRVICQSNLDQLGLALAQYAQDSDETLPMTQAPASGGQSWRETIYPYVKSVQCYECPEDTDYQRHHTPDDLPHSYSANHLGPDKNGREHGAFAEANEKPSRIEQTNANRTILLTDTRGVENGEWNMSSAAFLPQTSRALYVHRPSHMFYEHPSGMLNCLFVDGHVKSLRPMSTLTPINLWTRDNTSFSGQDLQNAQAILKHAEQE